MIYLFARLKNWIYQSRLAWSFTFWSVVNIINTFFRNLCLILCLVLIQNTSFLLFLRFQRCCWTTYRFFSLLCCFDSCSSITSCLRRSLLPVKCHTTSIYNIWCCCCSEHGSWMIISYCSSTIHDIQIFSCFSTPTTLSSCYSSRYTVSSWWYLLNRYLNPFGFILNIRSGWLFCFFKSLSKLFAYLRFCHRLMMKCRLALMLVIWTFKRLAHNCVLNKIILPLIFIFYFIIWGEFVSLTQNTVFKVLIYHSHFN